MSESIARAGKSKSKENPFGIRRINRFGKELSPRSIRRKHYLLKNCSEEQLRQAGVLK